MRRTCTWPAAWCSTGTAPTYDELVEEIEAAASSRPPLPPAARRSCRSARAGRCGSTTHTSTSPTTCATRRCRGPVATRSSSGWPAGCSPRRSTADRPLWELWLVEGLADDRFAVLSKTHHALVDGISGVDIATILFDTSPDPMPVAPPDHEWVPRPLPSKAQLLADALVERATVPGEIVRGVRAVFRRPATGRRARRQVARRGRRAGVDGTAGRAPRARSTCGSARTAASPGCGVT